MEIIKSENLINDNLRNLNMICVRDHVWSFTYVYKNKEYFFHLNTHPNKSTYVRNLLSDPDKFYKNLDKANFEKILSKKPCKVITLHKSNHKELMAPNLLIKSNFKNWLDKVLFYYEIGIEDFKNIESDLYSDKGVVPFLGEKYSIEWNVGETTKIAINKEEKVIEVVVESKIYKHKWQRKQFMIQWLLSYLDNYLDNLQTKWEQKLNVENYERKILDRQFNLSKKGFFARNNLSRKYIEYILDIVFWHPFLIEGLVLHEVLHSYFHKKCTRIIHGTTFYEKGNQLLEDFYILEAFLDFIDY